MAEYKIKGLAFQGGGTLGIAHVGAIQIFKEKGILDKIEYFVDPWVTGSAACTIARCSPRSEPVTPEFARRLPSTCHTGRSKTNVAKETLLRALALNLPTQIIRQLAQIR